MIIRALEGFLLHNGKLPTKDEVFALNNTYLVDGDPLIKEHPAIGECIGIYEGPDLPAGWEFVLTAKLPERLKPLLLLVDALGDLEWNGEPLPRGFLEAVAEQQKKYENGGGL